MRFYVMGGLAALTLAGCDGKGDTDTLDCTTVTSSADPNWCTCNPSDAACAEDTTDTSGGGGDDCLDINTLTMDSVIGWDGSQTTTLTNPFSGGAQFSYFAINFGGPGWSGDTSLPGAPDNWCFIVYNIDGQANDTSNASFPLNLTAGLNPGQGVTNCGRESSPGAGDMVTLCGGFFQGADPVADMAPLAWTFNFGGEIDSELSDIPSYFTGYGYTVDNFWGSQLSSDIFASGTVATVTYGWTLDGTGAVALDGNGDPIRHTASAWAGPNGVEPGFYIHFIPWLFTFQ